MKFNSISIILIVLVSSLIIFGCNNPAMCNTDKDCSTYCSNVYSCKEGYARTDKCSNNICVCCEEFHLEIPKEEK